MPKDGFTLDVETEVFNRHIKHFLKKSKLSTNVVLKKFAFDLLAKIILKNPVDKRIGYGGRSRAAWYVSMEKLAGDTMQSAKLGKSVDTNSQEVADGKAQGDFTDNTKGWNKWVELINGVRYIIFLEYGSSNQAPHGMVRLSMRELRKGKLPDDLNKQFVKDWNSFIY